MKIQEYQAKELLAERKVPVPRGRAIESADEAAYLAANGAVLAEVQTSAALLDSI